MDLELNDFKARRAPEITFFGCHFGRRDGPVGILKESSDVFEKFFPQSSSAARHNTSLDVFSELEGQIKFFFAVSSVKHQPGLEAALWCRWRCLDFGGS